ncbi:MAG TPA: transposase, partial [Gemmataceae bacterium]|nr:transposase [Gemmataceae bacterium]
EPAGRRVVLVWDGAPWHRAKFVQQTAADLAIAIIPLPGYSPDLNPIGLTFLIRKPDDILLRHDSDPPWSPPF